MDRSRGVGERLADGVLVGSALFFVFRAFVWPAVVVRDDAVIVRNPLVSYVVTGRSEVVWSVGRSPNLLLAGRAVPLLAFATPVPAVLGVDRELRRLADSLDARDPDRTGVDGIMADRRTILWQYVLVQAAMASVMLAIGL
ncbi:MAG: hypothetical protein HGA44_05990 [Cellulomonadaceae bacterium]|nr:hypothetical protein [Cellulomonadaceae bacterium]